ncbi:MAG: SBBP repeat-containing protein [Verrucomicrobia bacterium]|nr:SBBP repeat-containing protein [Verrucomicrobiota bacterium]
MNRTLNANRQVRTHHHSLIFAALLAMPFLAQSQTTAWINRYNGPGDGDDTPAAIAVDTAGNVVVTGKSVSTSTNLNPDYATIKYSSAGVPLWTNFYDGPVSGYDEATAVAVDGSGNVYVTGYSRSRFFSDDFDYATIKYSSAGGPLWTNRYDGPGNNYDQANAVAVDGNGNVYVSGYSVGAGTGDDYATIAYSSAGVALWTNRYKAGATFDGPDRAYAIGVDTNGHVFVTGYSYNSNGVPDRATLGYSSDGVPLWTNRYDPAGSSAVPVNAMAVEVSGNVHVTGSSWNGTNDDYVTIGHSSAGVPLWTNRYNGPGNGPDEPAAIAVDRSGNVFVTGHSWNGSSNAIATIAYSSAGMPVWTNRYSGISGASASALAVDSNGNVYVTGSAWYYDGSQFHYDYATIAYSSAGVALWTNLYNGPGDDNGPGNDYDQAKGVAVDASGNVYVTGQSLGSGTNYDYATIKYLPVPLLSILSVRPTAQFPATNGTGYTVSVVTNGTKVEHRLSFGGHHFLSLVNASGAFAIRPHPGVDRNGWGGTLYPHPFIAGAVLTNAVIGNITTNTNNVSIAASGPVSWGTNGDSYGTWTNSLSFWYDPLNKAVHGTGTCSIMLTGVLANTGQDLNIFKLANNVLTNVPLLFGGTNGNTGDMSAARFFRHDGLTNEWDFLTDTQHCPDPVTYVLAVETDGAFNQIDTSAQNQCPIQAAYKPSFRVILTSEDVNIPMKFCGFFDTAAATNFASDNIGINAVVLKHYTATNYAFEILFDSTAMPNDGVGMDATLSATYSGTNDLLAVYFADSLQMPFRRLVGALPRLSSGTNVFRDTIGIPSPPFEAKPVQSGFFRVQTPCNAP